MNNEIHTCDWFISFFEAIPEERWCLYDFLNESGRSCALGHCGVRWLDIGGTTYTPKGNALNRLFRKYLHRDADYINDGNDSRFEQQHPKLRILAALRDIKAKQEAAAEAFELRPLNLTKPQPKELCEQAQN